LVSELTRDNEPVSVLEKPACSVRLEEIVSDPVSVLENDVCSSRLEDMVSEPVSALKNEECPTTVEERANEPDRLLTKPLTSEPARDNEPVRVLDSEM